MTKKEWQAKYGFSDADMERIEFVVKLFNGKVVEVKDKRNE